MFISVLLTDEWQSPYLMSNLIEDGCCQLCKLTYARSRSRGRHTHVSEVSDGEDGIKHLSLTSVLLAWYPCQQLEGTTQTVDNSPRVPTNPSPRTVLLSLYRNISKDPDWR